MCIGIPMRVIETEDHFAVCEGRGERRRVNTVLVDRVVPGDWLLVFLDDARERIDAQRAAEVDATLDLVVAALQGDDVRPDIDFALPSQMTPEQLRTLTGG